MTLLISKSWHNNHGVGQLEIAEKKVKSDNYQNVYNLAINLPLFY